MALGNFQCWGVDGRARTYLLAIYVGKGCLAIFFSSLSNYFSFLSFSGDGSI